MSLNESPKVYNNPFPATDTSAPVSGVAKTVFLWRLPVFLTEIVAEIFGVLFATE